MQNSECRSIQEWNCRNQNVEHPLKARIQRCQMDICLTLSAGNGGPLLSVEQERLKGAEKQKEKSG